MKRYSFSRKQRLASKSQFDAVLRRRLSARDGLLAVYMAQNDCGHPRLGVSVGKSCGGAVVRNRLKRLLRETFRLSQDRIPAGFDYVVMVSPHWSDRSGEDEGKATSRAPTLEQIRASFLSLVAAAVERAADRRQKPHKPPGKRPENGAQ